MPEFSTPFQGNKCERKLTKEELIRAIRFSLASELEAIQIYEQLRDSIDNANAKKLLEEIAHDEKVHVGNFAHLIKVLSPDDAQDFEEGIVEAKEIMCEE